MKKKRHTDPNMMPTYIGRRLKSKRKSLGLNQAKGARVIGISLASLHNVEQGYEPGPRIGPKIQAFLMRTFDTKKKEDGTISLHGIPRR